MPNIVALCGGVGGAKLAEGLQRCLPQGRLRIIVNTGDDFDHRGLPISPDLDTVLYTLAGVAHPQQGWGRADESWQVQSQWREMGLETWFQLGDRDIALHLHRRELMSQGKTLTRITADLAARFGLCCEILPMCDGPAPTVVRTELGELSFQEYFVKHRAGPRVTGFRYGAASGTPMSVEVQDALSDEGIDGIILCPSNPYLSIAPILAVPGLRRLLAEAHAPVVAVSPVIGDFAFKGPTAKIMRELGITVSSLQIAREYRDFLDAMVIDEADSNLLEARGESDPALHAASIRMNGPDERRSLAASCLNLAATLRGVDAGRIM
jgi:LPPG:FO 2-phospho-L-lactate transferase